MNFQIRKWVRKLTELLFSASFKTLNSNKAHLLLFLKNLKRDQQKNKKLLKWKLNPHYCSRKKYVRTIEKISVKLIPQNIILVKKQKNIFFCVLFT
jgi:hypothetical protein